MDQIIINEEACTKCGICYESFGCPAIGKRADGVAFIHYDLCNSNGSCIQVCPAQAILRGKREVVAK